jgi:hypothetical protein
MIRNLTQFLIINTGWAPGVISRFVTPCDKHKEDQLLEIINAAFDAGRAAGAEETRQEVLRELGPMLQAANVTIDRPTYKQCSEQCREQGE